MCIHFGGGLYLYVPTLIEWHNADIRREKRLVVCGWERKREGGVGKEREKRKDMPKLFNKMTVQKKTF